MIAFWSRLSPFTRLLAIAVLLAAVGGSYARLRLKPQQSELAVVEKEVASLRKDVREARSRVERLEREAELARRWTNYARILEEQSTGRSLRDVIRTCGTDGGPDVEVQTADFERLESGSEFARLGVKMTVRGAYEEIVGLLDELDRVFPPVEITRADLSRIDTEADGTTVRAELEGIIHEAR